MSLLSVATQVGKIRSLLPPSYSLFLLSSHFCVFPLSSPSFHLSHSRSLSILSPLQHRRFQFLYPRGFKRAPIIHRFISVKSRNEGRSMVRIARNAFGAGLILCGVYGFYSLYNGYNATIGRAIELLQGAKERTGVILQKGKENWNEASTKGKILVKKCKEKTGIVVEQGKEKMRRVADLSQKGKEKMIELKHKGEERIAKGKEKIQSLLRGKGPDDSPPGSES